jgi:CelD/BcsL family acetyltransferase involved in cellulose biosynthesis
MFFNYIDKHQRENNIRFAMLKEDRDILHTLDAFYDPRVLQEIKKLPNGADYLETTNMTYLPLYGDFLRYAKNAYNKKSRKNERIDFSILDGLYSIFQVNDPLQLVEKIQSHLKQCDRKI